MQNDYDVEIDCERPGEEESVDFRKRARQNRKDDEILQSFSLLSSDGEYSDTDDDGGTSFITQSERGFDDDKTEPSVTYSMGRRPHPNLNQVCEVSIRGEESTLGAILEDEKSQKSSKAPAVQQEILTIGEDPAEDLDSENESSVEKRQSVFSNRKLLIWMIIVVLVVTLVLVGFLINMTRGNTKRPSDSTAIQADEATGGDDANVFSGNGTDFSEDLDTAISETPVDESAAEEATESPTIRGAYSTVLDFLGPIADTELLLDPATPQGRAFLKIIADNESSYESLTRSKVLQTYAVLILYLSTSPDVWHSNFPSVLSTSNVCSWSGVIECTDRDSGEFDVETIKLSRLNLEGRIPEEICLLDRLVRLDMSGNNLVGSVPQCLSGSNSLKVLYLDGNYLDGTLPRGIVLVPTLEEMQVSNNWFSGNLDSLIEGTFSGNLYRYGETWRLRRLNLENNRLTGTVPEYLGALGQLQSLTLHGNELHGEINDMICAKVFGTADVTASLEYLTADCQEVSCSCCNRCY